MTKNLLQGSKEDVYKKIQEELGKSKDDINADIKIIQEWCKTQSHLPEIPSKFLVLTQTPINVNLNNYRDGFGTSNVIDK